MKKKKRPNNRLLNNSHILWEEIARSMCAASMHKTNCSTCQKSSSKCQNFEWYMTKAKGLAYRLNLLIKRQTNEVAKSD